MFDRLVVVAAGQSNMLGWFTPAITGLHGSLSASVSVWSNTWTGGAFGAVKGLGADSFAQTIQQSLPSHQVVLINGSVGGTGLLPGGNGPAANWSERGPGSMFETVSSALSRNDLDADAVIWSQGERDAAGGVSASAYGAELHKFITDAGTAWKADSVAIVGLALNNAQGAQIRLGQQTAANQAGAIFVPVSTTIELRDTIHLSGASYAWQAVDAARAILSDRGAPDHSAPDVIAGHAGGLTNGTGARERILGSAATDIINAGDGNDIVRGLGGNDFINGQSGDDVLSGGSGDDIIVGGAGSDHVFGDLGNDTIVAGAGHDYIDGGQGVDTVAFALSASNYQVHRHSIGIYTVTEIGNPANAATVQSVERLSFAGHSVDIANLDIRTLTGTEAGDRLTGTLAADTIDGLGGSDVLLGGLGDDALHGKDGHDALIGGAGDDMLAGGADNDTLDGGAGADNMRGGSGNDIYFVDNALDVVSETEATGADAGGIDTVYAAVSTTLGMFIEHGRMFGATDITVFGNDLGNRIRGNVVANQIEGLAGDDTLNGDAGADRLHGGAGNDVLNGGIHADWMAGGSGNDTYYVDNAIDAVVEIDGVTGQDSGGIDTVFATSSTVLSAFIENLNGVGPSGLHLTGNAGANRISGAAGADTLIAGDGSDTLSGGGGDDSLAGGSGQDLLFGGTGRDHFVVEARAGSRDLIMDFAAGVDKIVVIGTGLPSHPSFNLSINGANLAGAPSLIYSTPTRTLSFDADGSGSGQAVELAQFASPAVLTLADFVIGGPA